MIGTGLRRPARAATTTTTIPARATASGKNTGGSPCRCCEAAARGRDKVPTGTAARRSARPAAIAGGASGPRRCVPASVGRRRATTRVRAPVADTRARDATAGTAAEVTARGASACSTAGAVPAGASSTGVWATTAGFARVAAVSGRALAGVATDVAATARRDGAKTARPVPEGSGAASATVAGTRVATGTTAGAAGAAGPCAGVPGAFA